MTLLFLLWIFTLSIIYINTYRKTSVENRNMMELYSSNYKQNGMPEDKNPPKSQRFQSSSFYSVAFRDTGTEVVNDMSSGISDLELASLAEQIMSDNKAYGSTQHMIYLLDKTSDYTLVVFMDNTIVNETFMMLIRNMLIFGGIAMFILFFISIFLSNMIIRPLEENDKRQQQFVSDAGHELKTPISTINANMELLRREVGNNVWLDNIEYENKRMEAIVKQLLELSRMQEIVKKTNRIDCSHLVLSCILPFEAKAFENNITFSYDIDSDLHITGDASQLQMLVATLIDNAFSHCKENGTITVKLSSHRNELQLIVSNQGDEIAVEERERIFDRFYRSDSSRTADKNHFGLGLAIAKNIVLIHRGIIYVTCEKGWTNFNVTLPINE